MEGGLESALRKLSFGVEELEEPVAELVEHIPLAVEVKDFSTEGLVLEPPSELAPEPVLVNVEGGLETALPGPSLTTPPGLSPEQAGPRPLGWFYKRNSSSKLMKNSLLETELLVANELKHTERS